MLGFPEKSNGDGTVSDEELAAWRDDLHRRFADSARQTLASLPELFGSMPRMPITQQMVSRIERALAALEAGGDQARTAWELAEECFFDQASLPLLYIPQDHMAAIYLPVFFPPVFALLSGWFALWKRYRERRTRQQTQSEPVTQ